MLASLQGTLEKGKVHTTAAAKSVGVKAACRAARPVLRHLLLKEETGVACACVPTTDNRRKKRIVSLFLLASFSSLHAAENASALAQLLIWIQGGIMIGTRWARRIVWKSACIGARYQNKEGL